MDKLTSMDRSVDVKTNDRNTIDKKTIEVNRESDRIKPRVYGMNQRVQSSFAIYGPSVNDEPSEPDFTENVTKVAQKLVKDVSRHNPSMKSLLRNFKNSNSSQNLSLNTSVVSSGDNGQPKKVRLRLKSGSSSKLTTIVNNESSVYENNPTNVKPF